MINYGKASMVVMIIGIVAWVVGWIMYFRGKKQGNKNVKSMVVLLLGAAVIGFSILLWLLDLSKQG